MSAICKDKDGNLVLAVKVHPKSSKKCVVEGEDYIDVYVNEPPEKGKANSEVVKLLAKHFDTSKSKVEIAKGETTRIKKVIIYK